MIQDRLTHSKIDFVAAGTWPPNYSNLDAALTKLGISPANEVNPVVHYHWHITVYAGGRKIVVPRNIGLQNPPAMSSEIHTHSIQVDKHSGILRVDRPQTYSNVCPMLYGFVPQTYCAERVGAYCDERTGRNRAVQVMHSRMTIIADRQVMKLQGVGHPSAHRPDHDHPEQSGQNGGDRHPYANRHAQERWPDRCRRVALSWGMMVVMAVRLVATLAGSLGRLRRHVFPRSEFLENVEDRHSVGI